MSPRVRAALLLCGLLACSHAHAANSVPETRTVARFADDLVANGSVTLRSEIILRNARFLAATQDRYSALAELLAAERRNAIVLQRGPASQAFAGWLQDAGLHQRAAHLAQASDHDWPGVARDAFWLTQARLLLRLDLPAETESALSRLQASPAEETQAQRRRLLAQSLLEQKQYNRAIKVLAELQGQTRNNLYDRYNLAVAWMGLGQPLEAIGVLDDIGQIPAETPELLALRDRANLVLAWTWLNTGQGGSARPLLRRIRQQGPDSVSALLGLGWAELAPDGNPQEKLILRQQGCMEDPARILGNSGQLLRRPPRESCDTQKHEVFRKRESLPFEIGGDLRSRNERALTAWRPLLDLPADQPAVREALLATAESWRALEAPKESRDAYRLTIALLTREQAALSKLIAVLAIPASDPVAILARNENRHRLTAWRASRGYQAILRQRALLDQTATRLLAMSKRIQALHKHARSAPEQQRVRKLQQIWTTQKTMINTTRAKVDQRVRLEATEKLRKEHLDAGRYLARARLGLASLGAVAAP